MSKTVQATDIGRTSTASAVDEVELKDPLFAAVLAWLIPGAGHWYQGRRSKAVLFFVCILGTFIYGLYLGDGRVVYASMRPQDRRLQYFCQLGCGLPSLPAVVQAYRVKSGNEPINFHLWNRFMVPPSLEKAGHDFPTELDTLQKRLNRYFELGTVFTMVAGLLNLLVVYDAWGGPAEPDLSPISKEDDEDAPQASGTGPPVGS